MKYVIIINGLLITTYWSITGIAQAVSPIPAPDAPVYSAQQQAQIGKIATDYLLAHPEMLMEIDAKLQIHKILTQHTPVIKYRADSDECALARR